MAKKHNPRKNRRGPRHVAVSKHEYARAMYIASRWVAGPYAVPPGFFETPKRESPLSGQEGNDK